jgi:hypothetical protein
MYWMGLHLDRLLALSLGQMWMPIFLKEKSSWTILHVCYYQIHTQPSSIFAQKQLQVCFPLAALREIPHWVSGFKSSRCWHRDKNDRKKCSTPLSSVTISYYTIYCSESCWSVWHLQPNLSSTRRLELPQLKVWGYWPWEHHESEFLKVEFKKIYFLFQICR